MKRKLNSFSAETEILDKFEQRYILGSEGRSCGCACYYRNVGGSSIEDNTEANYAGGPNGLNSPQGANKQKVDFSDGPQYFD